tara:strand:- start:319 stop:816 length:498 start_codon:yes stop_codon:yes gene_type:complete
MANSTYTTPEVAEIIEIPQRKLLTFIERGYVAPSVQDAEGHGTKRLWNYEDLIRCAIFSHLESLLKTESKRLLAAHLQDDRNIVRTAFISKEINVFQSKPQEIRSWNIQSTVSKYSTDHKRTAIESLSPERLQDFLGMLFPAPVALTIKLEHIHDFVTTKLEERC